MKSASGVPDLPGFEVFQAGRPDGTGNVILRSVGPPPRVILKIFRRRHRFLPDLARKLGAYLERRTASSARARYETERRSIEIWTEAGFRVPQVLDRPIPDGVDATALWLSWCEGSALGDYLVGPARTADERRDVIARVAADVGRRHRVAIERDEILLVQEHPTMSHVVLSDDDERPFFVDFENAYRPSYGVEAAVSQEIAALVRRLDRLETLPRDDLLDAFLEGYGDTAILRRATELALGKSGAYQAIVRWADRRRRGKRGGKTGTMQALAARLDAPPA